MINWYVETVTPATGDLWPLWGIQPTTEHEYNVLAPRLRKSGCRFLSAREYIGVMWPDTRCTITLTMIEGVQCVTEMHTGASRLMPSQAMETTPMFKKAAERGRVLLALLKPATLPIYGTDRALPAEAREHAGAEFEAAVGRGEVMAGFARVISGPAPRAGGLSRRAL